MITYDLSPFKSYPCWLLILLSSTSYSTCPNLGLSLYIMSLRITSPLKNIAYIELMLAKCLAQCVAHPKHFYCSCVFDALPYHLQFLTSPTEVYLVPTADIYSAVDSAAAIWQAVSGSAREWGGFCVGISSICFWERSSPCSLACAPLINYPRNGDAAEPHHLWKQADSLSLCFICLELGPSTTWFDMQLLSYSGFPSRVPAGFTAIVPRGKGYLLLKDSHRERNAYLNRYR